MHMHMQCARAAHASASQVRVRVNRAVALQPGDELSLGAATDGVRSYVCVGGGGVSVPSVLGSLATDVRAGLGGFQGRALRAGDRLGRRTDGGEGAAAGAGAAGEATGEAAARATEPGLVCAVHDRLRQDRGGGGGGEEGQEVGAEAEEAAAETAAAEVAAAAVHSRGS